MRPGQNNNNSNNNKNRSRGRNNNGGRKHLNPLSRNYESNGPDVKVRGNAAHIAEKYVQLARDAHASGDSVMAENYLQHAEHYYRIVSAAQPQQRTDQFGQEFTAEESEDDEFEGDGPNDRFEIPQFRQQQPVVPPQPQQNDRQDRPQQQGERSYNRDDRGPREDRQPRFDQQQRNDQPRNDVPAEGSDTPATEGAAPAEGPVEAAQGEGEPRRVRERRPRRRRPPMTEGGAVDPNGPQPDVGDLPAFITAGGATNPAE